jgi:diguanylate cyclase (GGDEF)-like protein
VTAAAVKWLSVPGISLAFGLLAAGGAILPQARNDAWLQAQTSSANLALALEREIARSILSYDLSLRGAIEALRLPDIDRVSPETRQAAIFGRAASTDALVSLLVVDAGNTIVADSTSVGPRRLSLADRDSFVVGAEQNDAGLFVGAPFRSRQREGEAGFAISRRIDGSGGRTGGVAIATIRLSYLQERLAALDLGHRGAAALFRTDGTLIARQPLRDSDFGRSLRGSPGFAQYAAAPSGHFVVTDSLDGVERLVTFRHVDTLPLVLAIGIAVDDIDAAWWPATAGIGAVLVAMCGVTVTLCFLFLGDLRRRSAAEKIFLAAAGRLSTFTDTDVLTRLELRRTFDGKLATEWQRAIRSETSIGLLIVDIDQFAEFNHARGRSEGDQALSQIAGCVRQALARPGDSVARYEDDRFAGLLPETELDGVYRVAENIRAAVAGLRIQRRDRLGRQLTVSIGIAAARPAPGSDSGYLAETAAAALAEAKRGGRDRVCGAAPHGDNRLVPAASASRAAIPVQDESDSSHRPRWPGVCGPRVGRSGPGKTPDKAVQDREIAEGSTSVRSGVTV